MYNVVDVTELHGGIAVASGATSVIVGPADYARWPGRSLTLFNQGPVTLSGAIVQVNPDPQALTGKLADGSEGGGPAAHLWATYDSATFKSLPSGQSRILALPGVYRYWRVVGVNDHASLSPTVSGYFLAVSIG